MRKRHELSQQSESLLAAAGKVAEDNSAAAVVLLAEVPYDFTKIRDLLRNTPLIVTSDKSDVQAAANEDDIAVVPLQDEPQTRQNQVSQALLEAVSDELLRSGDSVVTVYAGFEKVTLDTLTYIRLGEHLTSLTSRDLQKLETQVPLETLRQVTDMAIEIGREGREGKPVGALFVVGQHRKVMQMSHEQVHDPFKGYARKERLIRSPRVRESVKELAQIDGAFVISADGVVISAGRILDAPASGVVLSKGLGARHWAAAAITKSTKAIAIVVSQSTGTVRLFQDGRVVLRIEPMDRTAMAWHDVTTEPPPIAD
jgi:DNA integrity scanning protein DisA with diadenylate cyclase activity